MKRRCIRSSFVLALLLVGLACRSTEVSVSDAPVDVVEATAFVDRAIATTGDILTFTVRVEYDSEYEVEISEAGAEIDGFRVIDAGRQEPVSKRGRTVETRWYRLRADLVGSYILPAVIVRFHRSVEGGGPDAVADAGADAVSAAEARPGAGDSGVLQTQEIFVEVESVLPASGEAQDIRDIKPLQELPGSGVRLVLILLAAALAVVAVGAYVFVRRNRRPPQLVSVPPHELAFQALHRLRQIDFSSLAAVREYYFGLSAVLRTYVEGRYDLNATDLTKEEILEGLEDLELDTADRRRLQSFLLESDLVKFAAHVPSQEEIAEIYERAFTFVEKTKLAGAEVAAEA